MSPKRPPIEAPSVKIRPAKAGRPTSCTKDVTAAVVAALAGGCSLADAAALAGIADSTLRDWMDRGSAPGAIEPFSAFSAAVTRARSVAKAEAIQAVRQGVLVSGDFDWKSRAWWLERTFPEEYAPQQAVNVKLSRELESALDALKKVLPADAYDLALRALAGGVGGGTSGGEGG